MSVSDTPCCKIIVLLQDKVPPSTKVPNSARHPHGLAKSQGHPAAGGPSMDEPEPEVPWPPQDINEGVYLMFISSSIRHAICSHLMLQTTQRIADVIDFPKWHSSPQMAADPLTGRGEALSPIFSH